MKQGIRRIVALVLAMAMSVSLLSANVWATEPMWWEDGERSLTGMDQSLSAEEGNEETDVSGQGEDTSEHEVEDVGELERSIDPGDDRSEDVSDPSASEQGSGGERSEKEVGQPERETAAEGSIGEKDSEPDRSVEEISQPEQETAAEGSTSETGSEADHSVEEMSQPKQGNKTEGGDDKATEVSRTEDAQQEAADYPEAGAETSAKQELDEGSEAVSDAESSGEGTEQGLLDGEQSQENEALQSQSAEESKHIYKVYDLSYTWGKAKKFCEDKGGHLATITSKDEQKSVEEALSEGKRNCYWLGGRKESKWLGNKEKKNWSWITGEPFQFKNWAFGQPDNYGKSEDKLMIYRNQNPKVLFNCKNKWNDLKADCTCKKQEFFGAKNFGFVCEWDANLMMDEVIEIDAGVPTTVTAVYIGPKPQNISWGNDKGDVIKFAANAVDGPDITGVENMYWISTMVTCKRPDEYRFTITVDGQDCNSTLRVLPTLKKLETERHVKSVVLSFRSQENEENKESYDYVIQYAKKGTTKYKEKTTEDNRIRIDGLGRNKEYEFEVRPRVKLKNGNTLEGKKNTVKVKTVDRPSAEDCWGFKNPSDKIKSEYFEHYFDKEKAKVFSEDRDLNGKTGLCFGMCLSAADALNATNCYRNVYSIDPKQLPKYKTWDSLKADDIQKDNIFYAHAFQAFEHYKVIAPYVVEGVHYTNDIESNNMILKEFLDKYLYRGGDAVLLSLKTGKDCHTVWAMDYYENKEENRLVIYIYDPNRPGALREMTIDLNGTWSYNQYGGSFASSDENRHLGLWGLFEKMSVNEPKPTTPEKLKATSGVGKLTLKWKASKYSEGYIAECASDKQFKKNSVTKTIDGRDTTSVAFKELTSGTNYYFRVRAVRPNRTSDFSKTKKVKIK